MFTAVNCIVSSPETTGIGKSPANLNSVIAVKTPLPLSSILQGFASTPSKDKSSPKSSSFFMLKAVR